MNNNPKTFVKNNNLAQVKYSKLRDGFLSINLLISETIHNTISFYITFIICAIILLIISLLSFVVPPISALLIPFLGIIGPMLILLFIQRTVGYIFNTGKVLNVWRGLPTWDSIFKYQMKDHNVFQNAKFKFNMYKAILKTNPVINVSVA